VIYADPPWRLEPYSRDTGLDRAADNHYPTMTLDELKALQPKIRAGPNCALFLWATVPMLDQALAVMTAWGFAYRSHWIWLKSKVAHGYWNRNRHELLLVGVKGEVPAPAPGEQYESVRQFAVGAHSEKPDIFAAMIEEMFPTVPKLEMFARKQRPGWTCWGNEVEEHAMLLAHKVAPKP
jgi:N6-adenosine-specific RNA methylase IME4